MAAVDKYIYEQKSNGKGEPIIIGYVVNIMRKEMPHARGSFSFHKHGGSVQALTAATEFRDNVMKKYNIRLTKGIQSTKTGGTGVSYLKDWNKEYLVVSLGKSKTTISSISKLGYCDAIIKARDLRNATLLREGDSYQLTYKDIDAEVTRQKENYEKASKKMDKSMKSSMVKLPDMLKRHKEKLGMIFVLIGSDEYLHVYVEPPKIKYINLGNGGRDEAIKQAVYLRNQFLRRSGSLTVISNIQVNDMIKERTNAISLNR